MNYLIGFVDNGLDNMVARDAVTQSYSTEADPYNPGAVFCNATCACVCFTNDLKHIHLHAVGEDFDKTHNLAQELYDKANDEADLLAELALEYDINIPNFSLCANCIGWTPLVKPKYEYLTAIQDIISKLSVYVLYLEALRDSEVVTSDIQSKLDDMVRDWKVELNYKLAKRGQQGGF